MSEETNATGDGADVVALLRVIADARVELDAAMVACGIDPENWGTLVDPSLYTPENRRRMAATVKRVITPVCARAVEVVER
ncbi:hypothetical protein [Streptomyces sp. B6B3]|uniref:hypothetical protein n=1 Tax=Streptomyces sp. B6B3 TaxID=3153570 RepID=UPI00325F156E